jgi:hypothetical protein
MVAPFARATTHPLHRLLQERLNQSKRHLWELERKTRQSVACTPPQRHVRLAEPNLVIFRVALIILIILDLRQ